MPAIAPGSVIPLKKITTTHSSRIGRQILHAMSIPLLIPLYMMNATTIHTMKNGSSSPVLMPPTCVMLSVICSVPEKNDVLVSSPQVHPNALPM